MKNRDYLWCLANGLLDREEDLERLCSACRERALEERCPVCGQARENGEDHMDNPSFDRERFERLKGGNPG